MVVFHQNAFDMLSVMKTKQIFDCSVNPGDLFTRHLRAGYVEPFSQALAKLPGQICHILKGTDSLLEPTKNLSAAKSRQTPFLQSGLQLLSRFGFDRCV